MPQNTKRCVATPHRISLAQNSCPLAPRRSGPRHVPFLIFSKASKGKAIRQAICAEGAPRCCPPRLSRETVWAADRALALNRPWSPTPPSLPPLPTPTRSPAPLPAGLGICAGAWGAGAGPVAGHQAVAFSSVARQRRKSPGGPPDLVESVPRAAPARVARGPRAPRAATNRSRQRNRVEPQPGRWRRDVTPNVCGEPPGGPGARSESSQA